ncbi:MAG TPA: MOSC domain-containing protein [Terriglobia bacterium]|nr:MOSC domain-containing protein [Terriglobia bacterium]
MKTTPVVVSIQIAPAATEAMVVVEEIRAVPGRGLEGDRYFTATGTFSKGQGTGRQVTLIEAEALEALNRDYQVELDPKDSRRNIVTRNVALNHLVGREFRVGAATLRGMRLCEPCSHLERLVGKKTSPGLVHRGGLRADILTEGAIRIGDPILA